MVRENPVSQEGTQATVSTCPSCYKHRNVALQGVPRLLRCTCKAESCQGLRELPPPKEDEEGQKPTVIHLSTGFATHHAAASAAAAAPGGMLFALAVAATLPMHPVLPWQQPAGRSR